MVIRDTPPRYPRRGPSCLFILFILFGVSVAGFVIVNAETVRETIVPTPIPTATRSASEYAILADLSERDGEYEEAIEFYQTAILLDATKPEFFIRLINLLVQENQPEAALEAAEQATVLAPDNDDVWLAAAASYIANGDRLYKLGDIVGANLEYAKATTAAEKALALAETSMAYAYGAAGLVLQEDAQKYEQAQEMADNATLLDPNNPVARLYMAKVFEYQGFYTAAIEQYQLGIEADPTMAELYIGLAFNYYGTSDIPNAINSFEDAIAVDPDSAVAYDGIAFMYLQLGQDALAAEKAAEAVRLDPNLARAHGRLGQAYFRQFNYPEAIRSLETAVEMYGNITNLNASFFNMLATAYMRNSLDDCDKAVPLFEAVLTVNSLAQESAQEGLEECRRAVLENPS